MNTTDTPIYDEMVAEQPVIEQPVQQPVEQAPPADETSNPVGHGDPNHGEGHVPVTICHNGVTITVDDSQHHLDHHPGDTLGECVAPPVEEQPPVVEEPPVVVVDPPTPEPIVPPVTDEQPVTPPVVEQPPARDETPVTLCHDGDTWTLPAWQAAEHLDLGDPLGECVPVVQVDPEPVLPAVPVVVPEPVVTPVVTPVVAEVIDVAVPTTQAEVSVAVPTSNPVGLAETGLNAQAGMGIALALLVLGVALVRGTARAKRNR